MEPQICNLDHTADAGVEIFSGTIEELFKISAESMYRIMECPLDGITSAEKETVLTEPYMENLLVTFLNELNYYISVRHLLLFPILNLHLEKSGKACTLTVKTGIRKLTERNLRTMVEIKSVTYHYLDIKREPDGYRTKLIFDL